MKNFKKAIAVTIVAGGLAVSGAGVASADGGAGAAGQAVGSPGLLSGNVVQIPVDVPINLCGNTIDVIALLNPAYGNACVNAHGGKHHGKHHGHHHGHHGHHHGHHHR